MNIRGPVVQTGAVRSVDTERGQSELLELTVRPDAGTSAPATVTLWGKWVELATWIDPGMELLVTELRESTYEGRSSFATTADSFVVVEPDYLVDVTAMREWVQCPRMYYLNKLSGVPLNYPVVKGTLVHEVFSDLLRGRPLEESIDARIDERAVDLGLLDRDPTEVAADVRGNAGAIEGWLSQSALTEHDDWRSEQTLLSERYGLKGRADAVRRGAPVELKTGKNTRPEPRFQDKIQAACYALLLGEHREQYPETATLIYTKNSTLERTEEDGDLSPAKQFSVGQGLLQYVMRERSKLVAGEHRETVPTGFEAGAKCEYCFEQDACMVVSGRLDQESKAGQVGAALPSEERAFFQAQYRALETERGFVHREYRKLWEQSGEERAAADRALIDLENPTRDRIGGGRWRLTASKQPDAISKIRTGDLVLVSEGHPTREQAELGRVERLDAEELVVTTDEPLTMRRADIYPSEITIDRQLVALHDGLLKTAPARRDILFDRRAPAFDGGSREYISNNRAQNEAVNLAVNAQDCALIHGPPGTGKTYTLARTVQALVERGERVLLSAFTNRAVDNAVEALLAQGFEDITRVGSRTGVSPELHEFLYEGAGEPGERARALEEAPVVAATTASCGGRMLQSQAFDVAIVDEAAQLTPPGTFLATNRAERFVLVGDHQQLPPVVRGAESVLRESLFEQLIDRYPEAAVMLDRQYRMAQRIQWFSSDRFYDGALRPANGAVASRSLTDLGVSPEALPPGLDGRVSFHDPEGAQLGNTNPIEAAAIARLVEQYVAAGVDREAIGVIAPFRAQVTEITRRLPEVAVDTVDRFQGSAKELILISTTATGQVTEPIFDDHRRMNVAVTRAKRGLVLVGDRAALRSDAFYRELLEWAER